jgi:TRAP transporter 4TM/12TM fusion protein
MMKKTGFKPEHAAAIEAVASTGGQIMPPIMGSAAFLMASFLEVPYVDIMKMAVVPALLFYVGAGIGVFFLVRSAGLNPPKMTVSIGMILRTLPVFVLPMTVVIWLLVGFYSPGYAAFAGICTMVVVAMFQKVTRPNWQQWIEGLTEAAKIGAQLALILALVGILAQVAVTTNLATKLSQAVIGMVGNELIPILLISAVIAILLGMELPTPVAYIIMFVTVVPLMIDAGVDQFAANFFAFYFAILSTLTPPVALSVLAASRIAGSGFLETCKHSIRLSFVGYLLPFAMAVTPALLGFPDKIGVAGWVVIGIFVLASIAGSAGMYGYFLRPLGAGLRAVLMAAALAGIAYVFNQDNTMLAVFFGLLAIGTVTPLIANMRERKAGIAS